MDLDIKIVCADKILTIKNICVCERCIERGMPELFLYEQDGSFYDCIRLDDLLLYIQNKSMQVIDLKYD